MKRNPRIAIVGAGLGGLCAGVKLAEAGFDDFTILESGDAVGGTWRDNTYPGCACDVQVSLYQFSFAPSLEWSHLFPRQPEIHRYAEDVADRFGLRDRIRLNSPVHSVLWDAAKKCWRVRYGDAQELEAEFVIAALGQLNRPAFPDLAGRESFEGPSFHAARWDHSVDLKGKRIGLVGAAASAVQIVPELAEIAEHLFVYQRTPNWVVPRMDREITKEEKALLLTAPHVAALAREQSYQAADHLFWQVFSFTEEGRAAYTAAAKKHLEQQVPDAELRAKLTPNYPVGCKRILFTDDYYPALMRENVTLIDAGIEEVKADGIATVDGETQALDVLVYATGFETTGWHWSMDVIGREKLALSEAWSKAPEAYLGITVKQFPNIFILYGPNTNLGHNSITFMLERQVEYTVQALRHLRDEGLATLEVTEQAQTAFNQELQDSLARTVWADPTCSSWYKNEDGVITQNWGSHTRDYAAAVKTVNWEHYKVDAS